MSGGHPGGTPRGWGLPQSPPPWQQHLPSAGGWAVGPHQSLGGTARGMWGGAEGPEVSGRSRVLGSILHSQRQPGPTGSVHHPWVLSVAVGAIGTVPLPPPPPSITVPPTLPQEPASHPLLCPCPHQAGSPPGSILTPPRDDAQPHGAGLSAAGACCPEWVQGLEVALGDRVSQPPGCPQSRGQIIPPPGGGGGGREAVTQLPAGSDPVPKGHMPGWASDREALKCHSWCPQLPVPAGVAPCRCPQCPWHGVTGSCFSQRWMG